ncbi:MAG: glycosyltransferase [bacterium]|nr:glycosyltransferase [bacterium]
MTITLGIVTPTYNQAQFVRQTMESVLSQEGDFSIDYIVINDGATDSTKEVLDQCKRDFDEGRIPKKCNEVAFRVVHRENRGQTPTINQGLSMVRGNVLAWMNSDDYYLPGAFQAVADTYREDPSVDFFYADCLKVREGSDKKPTIEPRPRPDETLKSLRERGNSFDMNFFTRRIIEKVGYPDESLNYCMDLDLWFRIFSAGKAKYVPYTVAAFRIWPGSKTSRKQAEFAKERAAIAARYGGNIIPSRKIYQWRGRQKYLDVLQKRLPFLYWIGKNLFYGIVDLFKYQPKKTTNPSSRPSD